MKVLSLLRAMCWGNSIEFRPLLFIQTTNYNERMLSLNEIWLQANFCMSNYLYCNFVQCSIEYSPKSNVGFVAIKKQTFALLRKKQK